jgi:predicted nuclease with TOPRIM domain
MAMRITSPTETIDCPLCLGAGRLKRTEVLDRLGVKDFARVAQLSAEEAFRLLQSRHDWEQQNGWSRFETELAKRTAEIRERHKDELHVAQSEKDSLVRRVEDCLREVAQLRERNQELEGEMAKASRRGKLEELSFEQEARSWAGIHVSEKLARGGDYILAYRDPSGAALEPRIVVDNKDKACVSEADIRKLIRDSKERHSPVGIIVAKDETQLRQHDREQRWGQEDGVWILRTTRAWLPRDLEVLKPVFERMRTEGADFLQRNSALAEEVRRTFVDLDEIERELKKATKAIQSVSALVVRYKERLRELCDSTANTKIAPAAHRDLDNSRTVSA